MTQRNGNAWMKWALGLMTTLALTGMGMYTKSVQSQVDSSKADHAEDLSRVESRVLHLVDTNSRDISETKGDIKSINTEIGAIKEDVGELKDDVKEIGKGVGDLQMMQHEMMLMLETMINGDTAGGFRP